MAHTYAQDMHAWKAWMKEYRYGIILIIPPDPHKMLVSALRNSYAWSQSSQCDAHISLTVPIPRPVEPRHLEEITDRLAHFAPFSIAYGPIIREPKHPGVVLDIAPQAEIERLLHVVEEASLFDGAIARKWPFYAHMTIAEMLTMEQTHEILAELSGLNLSGQFCVDRLAYIVPDDDFAFTTRATVKVGRNCC
jgi:hypothetical protein